MSTFVVAMALSSAAWGQATAAAAASKQAVKTALDTAPAQGNSEHRTATNQGSAAGETALDTTGVNDHGDQSALASPVPPLPKGATLAVGTEVKMTLTQAVSSGLQMNGDKVYGMLAAPVRTTSGAMLPGGTAVEGTVVSSAKAGLVTSGGILSLQLTRVGGMAVITDVVGFTGQEGHKDVADSAPDKGTEAMAASGTTLDFHVLQQGKATGMVPGVAPANNAGGGQNGGSGSVPSAAPRVPRTPVHGATQGVTPH